MRNLSIILAVSCLCASYLQAGEYFLARGGRGGGGGYHGGGYHGGGRGYNQHDGNYYHGGWNRGAYYEGPMLYDGAAVLPAENPAVPYYYEDYLEQLQQQQ